MSRKNALDSTAIAERRERVAQMYLRGMTQTEIAGVVGIDVGNVCRDLAAIRRSWQESAEQAISERTAQELAKLDQLERTHWDAWERSRTNRVRTYIRNRDGGISDEHVTEEQRDGNPEFLKGVERCVNRRCELLGLVERRQQTGGPTYIVINGVDADVIVGRKPAPHYAGRQNLN